MQVQLNAQEIMNSDLLHSPFQFSADQEMMEDEARVYLDYPRLVSVGYQA